MICQDHSVGYGRVDRYTVLGLSSVRIKLCPQEIPRGLVPGQRNVTLVTDRYGHWWNENCLKYWIHARPRSDMTLIKAG